jgi:hypothetical protein
MYCCARGEVQSRCRYSLKVFAVPAAANVRGDDTSDFLETVPSRPIPFDATDADYGLEGLFNFKNKHLKGLHDCRIQ